MSDLNWESPDGSYLYDYTDGTWSSWNSDDDEWESCSPPAGITPPPIQWTPGDANRPPDTLLPSTGGPTPPKVPGGNGSGNTSVDTPSLDLFVTNVKQLIAPVTGLVTTLKTMTSVQPGAFYHADLIRTNVNGDNGDGGLKANYHLVCTDLGNGLQDLHDAIQTLSNKYTTTEDANTGTAEDVQRALNGATGYFGGIIPDAGGSSQPGT